MPNLNSSFEGKPQPSRETLIREQADRQRKRLAALQLQQSQRLASTKRLEELQHKRMREEEQLTNTLAKLGTIQEEKKSQGPISITPNLLSARERLTILDGLLAQMNKAHLTLENGSRGGGSGSAGERGMGSELFGADRLEDLESILDEMERDLSFNRGSLSSRLRSSSSKQRSFDLTPIQRSSVSSKLDQIDSMARAMYDNIEDPEQLEQLIDSLSEVEQTLRPDERSFENLDVCRRSISELGFHLMARKRAEIVRGDVNRVKLQKLELSKVYWVVGKFKWKQVSHLEEELDNRVAPARLATLLIRLATEKEELGLWSVTALLLNTELLEDFDREHGLKVSQSTWSTKEQTLVPAVLRPILDVITEGWLQAVRHAIEWSVKKDSELDSHLALAHLAAYRKMQQINILRINPEAREELIGTQQDLQCISVWARQWALRTQNSSDYLQFTCFAVLHEAEQIERLGRRLRGIANPEQQAMLHQMIEHCNAMCEEILDLKADQIRALMSQIQLLRSGRVAVDVAAEELSDVLAVAVRCQRKLLADQTPEQVPEATRKRHNDLATLVVMLKRAQLARLQAYNDNDSRRGEIFQVQDLLGEVSIGLQEELEGRVLTRLQQAEENPPKLAEEKELAQMKNEYRELNADCILWELRKTEQEIGRIEQGQIIGFELIEIKVLDVEKEILKARVRELEVMHIFWATEAKICPDSLFSKQILKQRKRMARYDRLLIQRAAIVERLCSQKDLDEQGRRFLAVHQAESEVESEAEYLRSNLTDTDNEISNLRDKVREPIDQTLQLEEEAMLAAESLGQSEAEFATFKRFDEKRAAEAQNLARLYKLVLQESLEENEEQRMKDKQARLDDLLHDEMVAAQFQQVLHEAEAAEAEEEALEQSCRDAKEKAALFDLMGIYSRDERKENEKLASLKKGCEVWRVPRNSLAKAHRTRLWLEVTSTRQYILHWDSKYDATTKVFRLSESSILFLDSKHGLFATKKWPFRGMPVTHEGLCFSLLDGNTQSLDVCCLNKADFDLWTKFLQDALVILAWGPNIAADTVLRHASKTRERLQSLADTPPDSVVMHILNTSHPPNFSLPGTPRGAGGEMDVSAHQSEMKA